MLLEQMLHAARQHADPVILLLNSAGVRVDQGLPALGAFRGVFRAALEMVTEGVPLLACVGHDCFGGASMLAALAEQRVYARDARLSVSGPRVIEAISGKTQFDAGDPRAVSELLGPEARLRWHGTDVVAPIDPVRLRRHISSWLIATGSHIAHPVTVAHEKLSARLRDAGMLVESAKDMLVTTDVRSSSIALTRSRPSSLAQFSAENSAYIGLISRDPAGVLECWTLADALLDLKEREPGRPVLLALDVPGHSPLPRDERLMLSDYVVHMGLVLINLRREGHHIRLILEGQASGAIYAALSAGVDEVLATASALVQVLPSQAVTHITGNQHVPASHDLIEAGVADKRIA